VGQGDRWVPHGVWPLNRPIFSWCQVPSGAGTRCDVHQTLLGFLHCCSSCQGERVRRVDRCNVCCWCYEGRPLFPRYYSSGSLHNDGDSIVCLLFLVIMKCCSVVMRVPCVYQWCFYRGLTAELSHSDVWVLGSVKLILSILFPFGIGTLSVLLRFYASQLQHFCLLVFSLFSWHSR
jgi:hypothetical protein